MNSFVTSLIRTYVPVGVGLVVGWVLATFGFEVPKEQVAEVTVWASGAVTALYYLIVRIAERRFPSLGWLLGRPATVRYQAPAPAPAPSPESGEVTISAIFIAIGILVALLAGLGLIVAGVAKVLAILVLAVILIGVGVLISK
jgi:hypothetical protein